MPNRSCPLNTPGILAMAGLLTLTLAASKSASGQQNRDFNVGAGNSYQAPNPKENNHTLSTRPASKSPKATRPSLLELKQHEIDLAIKAGNAARDANNYELALTNYRKVITELKSEDERAYYGLGNVYVDLYCYDSAVEAYSDATNRKPKYLEALIGLGYAYVGKERFDDAAAQFRAALDIKPESADAIMGLGHALLAKGKYVESLAQFNRVINVTSFEIKDKASAHVGLGDVYWKQEKRAEAIKEFQEAIHLKPDFAWAYVELGNARTANAFPKHLNNPAEAGPGELEALHALAKQATADQEDARKFGYRHPQLFLNMALSLSYQRRYAEASAKIDEYFAEVKKLEEKISPTARGCSAGFDRLKADGYWYRGNVAYLQGLASPDVNVRNKLLNAAIDYSKNSISLKEDHVGAHWMLALLYLWLNRHQEAITEYETALRFSTEESAKASLYSGLGTSFSALGRGEDAVQNFQEAIKRNPNKPEFYRWLAGAYITQGKLEDAIAQLKKAEELSAEATAEGTDSYYSLGVAYGIRYINKRNEDDFLQAVKTLKKLTELRPKYAEPYNVLGGLYFIKNDAAASLDYFETAIKLDPKNPNNYLNMGRVYSELKKNDDAALERFNKAIEVKSDLSDGHRQLGKIYWRRKNYLEATSHFQEAIKYDAKSMQAYLDLADLYRAQKNYEEAIKLLGTAIGIAPKNAELYQHLGLTYYASSNAENAVTNFNRAIEYDQRNSDNYFYLARVYSELRHDDEAALTQLLKGTVLNPKDSDFDVAIADVHRRKKNYPEAIKYFDSAIKKTPNVPWTYKELAKIYEVQGKNEDAIRCYEEALKRLDPNDSSTAAIKELYLGRQARLRGKYDEAIAHFRNVNYPDEPGQSIYDIGVVYVLTKKNKLAGEQLAQLIQLKSALAEDLRKMIAEMK